MLVGSQLLAVASTLTGAKRLQHSVMGASRAADGTGDYDLFAVLTNRFKVTASVAVTSTAAVIATLTPLLWCLTGLCINQCNLQFKWRARCDSSDVLARKHK